MTTLRINSGLDTRTAYAWQAARCSTAWLPSALAFFVVVVIFLNISFLYAWDQSLSLGWSCGCCCLLLLAQLLEQCLAHSRSSLNICWMNEWTHRHWTEDHSAAPREFATSFGTEQGEWAGRISRGPTWVGDLILPTIETDTLDSRRGKLWGRNERTERGETDSYLSVYMYTWRQGSKAKQFHSAFNLLFNT